MPTALVTGGTGFVGSHLVDLLIARGWRVSCTVRRTSNLQWLEGKEFTPVEADFRRPLRLPEVDVVFHVAGTIRGESYKDYRIGNWLVSKHMIEAARCGRFVHVSSIAAAGPGVVDETSPCRPVSDYGRSKLEGELEVWKHRDRVPVTVVRPPIVYGERDTGLLDVYRTLAMGVRPSIGGPKRVSIVSVADLVEGMLAAAEHPKGAGETFFLCDSLAYEMGDLMDRILSGMGRRAVRVSVPDRVVRFAAALTEDVGRLVFGRMPMFNRDKATEMTQEAWVCSPEKAARLLGWRSRVPIDRGLGETLAWYRGRGLLR